MGNFLPLKDIKITQILSQRNKKPRPGQNLNKKPRPGQNVVLKIDWTSTGTYFGLRQILAQNNTKLGKKLNTQNRLDWPTTHQLAQNNPRMGQNKILRIDWTGANFNTS